MPPVPTPLPFPFGPRGANGGSRWEAALPGQLPPPPGHLVSRSGREVRAERKERVINRGDSSRTGAAGWQAAVTWHCCCVLLGREREKSANC